MKRALFFGGLSKIQTGILCGVLLMGIAFLAGTLFSTNRQYIPSDTSADAGFSRDMTVHHNQAVDLSFIVRDKTDSTAIRQFAFDIINTQSVQMGMMSGWLHQWGLPQTSSRPAMEWAVHNTEHAEEHPNSSTGKMPGMASREDIDRLQQLSDNDAEVLYLELMIKHHEGGITMAESALSLAKDESVRQLAQSIVDSQQAEIDVMQNMLKERVVKKFSTS